ncbi:AbrB family transcriptional regulator [Pseudorhodobacter sp.]|uniref:AbrB family transcriptional regulator n=1 Tax=Pseudorhodobacter sp. TaxID=1934400 RepID=UPI002649374D|nr:AbrB family transcriptional regulator [Pseudorhodobacter sp.]MDN5786358.1 AbrB family transcriptional regulator [Pseudorhodobacter sp.]
MRTLTIGKTEFDLPALAATLAFGTIGGFAGKVLGLPLGYLLGSLLVVALFAIAKWRVLGQPIHMPQPLRMSFIPIIGVGIGGAFTPAIFHDALGWWPTVLALFAFVPLAHFTGYQIYRRGGVTRPTAYFGSVPGGLMETVVMGEEAGADVALLVLMQFMRLILTIVFMPVLFTVMSGHAVGSASGVLLKGSGNPLDLWNIAVLLVAGIGGYFAGRALRFPAAIMTGPLMFSAVAHLTGLTDAVPPNWMISMTQIVVGTGLGARFAGMAMATLRRGFGLAVLSTAASLTIAFGVAELLHAAVGMPVSAVFLAFAPGGITEMSLIALSLQISVVYVTLHHVCRIVLAIMVARYFYARTAG